MELVIKINHFFYLLFKRRFNIVKTLYINFRMFPFSVACKVPVYIFGNWKLVDLDGRFEIKAPIRRGMISIGVNIAGYVETSSGSLRMKKDSQMIFYGRTLISQGCQIYLNDGAILEFYDEAKLGDSVKIFCYKHISIGEMSEVTWESQVTDFNSHFIEDMTTKQIKDIINPVYIGKRNWIGNRTTIMPGTCLPDNIIVTSNSLLNKNYSLLGVKEYSLIGGMPAVLIKSQVKRIYSYRNEAVLRNYFRGNGGGTIPQDILIESEQYS